MAFPEEIKILINRVCRSAVPVSIIVRDRWRKYIQASLLSAKIPPLGRIEMFIQGSCIILSKHCNFLNMRICHIAQRKINGTITACNRHGGCRTLGSQFPHLPAIPACQNNSYCSHTLSPAFINVSPLSSTPPT